MIPSHPDQRPLGRWRYKPLDDRRDRKQKKLQEPSEDLTTRVLTEVDFEDRLNGFSLRERAGPVPVTLYSFKEVVSLLNDRHPRLDFNELEGWVRKTMGDEELAEEIAKTIRGGRSDQERAVHIRKLMEERLNQCRKPG